MRDGAPARVEVRREALAIGRVPAVQRVVRRLARGADHDGHVLPLDVVPREERLERLPRRLVLGDHQEPARALVQPVHDAGPQVPCRIARIGARALEAAAREERVDQRAALVAARGVDDQAGGLVDDEEVGVLEDDGELDGCVRLGRRGGRRLGRDLDAGAGGDRRGGAGRAAVEEDAAVLDPALHRRAGGDETVAREEGDDERVEAIARVGGEREEEVRGHRRE